MPPVSQLSIRIAMERKGLTISQFAKRIGITETHTKKIVHGKQDIVSLKLINKIADVLGVPSKTIRTNASKISIRKLFGDDDITF